MGKKLASSFKNMVLVLFVVTLVSSAAVGVVNTLTSGTIAQAKIEKQIQAIRNVVPPGFDNDPMTETYSIAMSEKDTLKFYPAKQAGVLTGTAVKTYTNDGFSGRIWLMVGFNPDGTIYNYSVLEHKETPGLGSKMDTWFVKDAKGDITGKAPGTNGLKVSKDGGNVDAITAATISSRAFLDAINRAAKALIENNAKQQPAPTQENEVEQTKE